MTVWSISFQLPLFIRSFSGCAWVDWQRISEIHRTFLKKSYCRTMYSNSLFQKSPIHYIVFKLNAYMAWKCRSLFCQIPSEIPSQTLMSFRNYKRINVLFFSPKGQLLYSIAAQMLAYRFVLYLRGTAKIQWLLI